MSHATTIVRSTTPTGTRPEFRILCDKCGLVDKAGDERSAEAIAKHHSAHPHRSRMLQL